MTEENTKKERPLEALAVSAGQVLSTGSLDALTALARVLSQSNLTPPLFRAGGHQSTIQAQANCFLVCELSVRMDRPVLELMQAAYEVKGNLGFKAEFQLAQLQRSGHITGAPRYETVDLGSGPLNDGQNELPDIRVFASVVDANTGEEVSASFDVRTAIARGYTRRPGNNYVPAPESQCGKRAMTFLIREHYPDVTYGQRTVDELQDIRWAEADEVREKKIAAIDRLSAGGRVLTIEPEEVAVEPAAEETQEQEPAAARHSEATAAPSTPNPAEIAPEDLPF